MSANRPEVITSSISVYSNYHHGNKSINWGIETHGDPRSSLVS